jgi:hypothetical protein
VRTWLMIFRGDPLDGGTPIGVVEDRELCLAAVRAAWATMRRVYAAELADPVEREGVEGMERRLRRAAADLEGRADPETVPRRGRPGREGSPRSDR